jgi:ABC-type polysaccharide/polyol phosphate transport system ATPase subunit
MALIEFDNVSKAFTHSGEAKLLRAHVWDRLKRRPRSVFYALRNVSFILNHGESLAVIGRNGAGKSTLLSLVAGLCQPSEGRVTLNGRPAAFLQLGSGFHPDLTGVENTYLNASLMGLSRKRTEELLPSIFEFAEIDAFLNDPIRTYSSGMVMRLGFAVAVHADADILIIDEVLGVGDQRFQKKCFDKIRELQECGKSLLFVSHGAETVRQFCNRALWLDQGEVMLTGPADRVLEAYSGSAAQRISG